MKTAKIESETAIANVEKGADQISELEYFKTEASRVINRVHAATRALHMAVPGVERQRNMMLHQKSNFRF